MIHNSQDRHLPELKLLTVSLLGLDLCFGESGVGKLNAFVLEKQSDALSVSEEVAVEYLKVRLLLLRRLSPDHFSLSGLLLDILLGALASLSLLLGEIVDVLASSFLLRGLLVLFLLLLAHLLSHPFELQLLT